MRARRGARQRPSKCAGSTTRACGSTDARVRRDDIAPVEDADLVVADQRPRRARARGDAARCSGPCRRRRTRRVATRGAGAARAGAAAAPATAAARALVALEAVAAALLVRRAVHALVGVDIHAARCCSSAANESKRRPASALRFTYSTPDSVLPLVRARYGRHARGCTSQSRQNATKAGWKRTRPWRGRGRRPAREHCRRAPSAARRRSAERADAIPRANRRGARCRNAVTKIRRE